MTIAATLKQYLDQQAIDYDELPHPPTLSAIATAEASHIPARRIAKGVVLNAGKHHVLAVLPASRHIRFPELREIVGLDLELAEEPVAESLFPDCAPGAVPAIGKAYGLPVVLDEHLASEPEVYVEAGDHRTLVHLNGQDFQRLMTGARHVWFSEPV